MIKDVVIQRGTADATCDVEGSIPPAIVYICPDGALRWITPVKRRSRQPHREWRLATHQSGHRCQSRTASYFEPCWGWAGHAATSYCWSANVRIEVRRSEP